MNQTEQAYHDAFVAYLRLPGPPKESEVPPVPPDLDQAQAREIRWRAYSEARRAVAGEEA